MVSLISRLEFHIFKNLLFNSFMGSFLQSIFSNSPILQFIFSKFCLFCFLLHFFSNAEAGFCPSGFIIFCLLKTGASIRLFQISHRGCSTSQKQVQNPLVSSRTFFAGQETFLGSIYSFLLMSNKNLSFLPSNITQGVINFPKIGAKSSSLQSNFFCRLGNFFGFDLFLTSDEQ